MTEAFYRQAKGEKMGQKLRNRCRSLGVFLWLSLVSWVLANGSFVIGQIELRATGYTSLYFTRVWLWAFAFPLMLTESLGHRVGDVIWCLNPFFYGGIWWFAWRMWHLLRHKPAPE